MKLLKRKELKTYTKKTKGPEKMKISENGVIKDNKSHIVTIFNKNWTNIAKSITKNILCTDILQPLYSTISQTNTLEMEKVTLTSTEQTKTFFEQDSNWQFRSFVYILVIT